MCQMSDGSEFQTDGLPTAYACSPNLVMVSETVYVSVSVDECSLCRQDDAAAVSTVDKVINVARTALGGIGMHQQTHITLWFHVKINYFKEFQS